MIAVVPYLYASVAGTLYAPGIVGIVERIHGNGGMKIQHCLFGKRLVLEPADRFHRAIVVENHLFTSVAWAPPGADHLRSHRSCGGSTLKLAGRDRLLDQRVDGELAAGGTVSRPFDARTEPQSCLTVDVMQHLQCAVNR